MPNSAPNRIRVVAEKVMTAITMTDSMAASLVSMVESRPNLVARMMG